MIREMKLCGYKSERTSHSSSTAPYRLLDMIALVRTHRLLVLVLLSSTRVSHSLADSLLPKTAAVVPGDLMLGALMMVHERENETIGCGDVMVQGGVQAVEAMIFTLEWVNRNKIIPYTTLGARILDDCDKDTYGLQQAVDFIKGKVESLQSGIVCNYVNSTERVSNKPTTGVVAASSSVTSIQVANLLKLFQIPQVSYFSSSPELSDRNRYPYFFRTIPSDTGQVSAMRALLKSFKWKYVSIIYEDSSYGTGAYNLLEQKLREDEICIAYKAKLPKDFDVGRPENFIPIVRALNNVLKEHPMARGVIVYGSDQEVRGFMSAIRSESLTGKFTFIGSDGWSAREEVYKEDALQAEVLGTISVQPMADGIHEFDEYFRALTVENNTKNPWFYEMWERVFQCRYPGKPLTRNNARYNGTCTGKENIGYQYEYEKQLQFVSDAVLVFAYALRDYFRVMCRNIPECIACYNGRTTTDDCVDKHVDGTLLRDFMNNVTFTGLAGSTFEFGEGQSDPPPRYNIIHFREDPETNDPIWVRIGTYTKDGLKTDMDLVQFYVKEVHDKPPPSYCSNPCTEDEVRITQGDDKCCWTCAKCKEHEIRVNETTCRECDRGWRPNPQNRSECLQSTIEASSPWSVYGVICLLIAFVGFVCTVFQLAIFVKFNDTPIVKASGRELSYVIIVGLFLCFLVTPFTLAHPSALICGVQRFLAGFCFTVVYAAILTKTNRIARIFRSGRRTIRRPNFISPKSQLTICALVASVQIVIVAIWMLAYPPKAQIIHPTRDENRLICVEAISNRYLLAYFYPIGLCIVCTLYAVKTRKMPEAFNESHYIGAAVYTTCVIWLAFVPVYIVAKDSIPIRVTSVCISTSMTAFVCQFSLFWPKIYIILFKPERNVRTSIMGPKATGGGTGVSKSLIRSTSNAQGAASMASMYRTEESSGAYSEDEYFNLPNVNRRSESRNTVATQTSPLRDTDDETVDEHMTDRAASTSSTSGGQLLRLERSVDSIRKVTLDEAVEEDPEDDDDNEDEVPHTPTAPLPPASVGSGSRGNVDSLSPCTPQAIRAFDAAAARTNSSKRRQRRIPFSLHDQYLSAPYIDGDTGSMLYGNGAIEQGDVSL